jgi:transposase
LEFQLEELEAAEAEAAARSLAQDPPGEVPPPGNPNQSANLWPEHLRREDVVIEPANNGACTCPDCGGAMKHLGEDVSEALDYVPGHFRVIRHVRPKFACSSCDAITQAPAPPMPTRRAKSAPSARRGRATPAS